MRAALLFPLLAAALYWAVLRQDWYGDDWIWLHGAMNAHSPLDLFRPDIFDFVRPTTNLFWWTAWRLGGLDPAPALALLVTLHAATAAGVLAWLRPRVAAPVALAAALLFLVSTSCRAAVSWPSSVGDVLVGCGTVWSLVALDRRPALVPLVALLTMMAKESALPLPLLLLAADPKPRRLHALTLALGAAFYAWDLGGLATGHERSPLDAGLPLRWAELAGDAATTLPLGVAGVAVAIALALALRTRDAWLCLLWLAVAAAPYAYYRRDTLYPRYLYPPTVAGVCLLGLAADRANRKAVGAVWLAAVAWHVQAFADSPYVPVTGVSAQSLREGAAGAQRLYVWQRADYAAWGPAMASVVTGNEDVRELSRLAFEAPRPGDRLLAMDEGTGLFYDFRPAWELLQGRVELLPGTRPLERQGDGVLQWQTLASYDLRGSTPWRRVRLEGGNAVGYSSYLALDGLWSPLHLQAVAVDLRNDGEPVLLTWDREGDPEPSHARAITSSNGWLIPVGHPDWLSGGPLRTLRVHPRATAGPVVVERISLLGFPHRVSAAEDPGHSMPRR